MTGGVFPQGDLESSKAYLAVVASKIINCSYDEFIDKLSGVEFLELINEVKGLFIGLGLEALVSKTLEKQS